MAPTTVWCRAMRAQAAKGFKESLRPPQFATVQAPVSKVHSVDLFQRSWLSSFSDRMRSINDAMYGLCASMLAAMRVNQQ